VEMSTDVGNEGSTLISGGAGRRSLLIVGAILTGLAVLAWVLTARQAIGMSGMVTGLGQIGWGMPNDMAAPLFMVMWLTMMVAMMLPTVGPLVLTHQRGLAPRREGMGPTLAFLLGYLAVWTAVGLAPLAAFLGFRTLPMEAASSHWIPLVSGLILLAAGLYQFTPVKKASLGACRSSLSFQRQGNGRGGRSAFQTGLAYSIHCLGCCWALMATLLVVGLMNLLWMAALTLVLLVERNSKPYGMAFSRAAGVLVAALGVAVIARPEFLAILSHGFPGAS